MQGIVVAREKPNTLGREGTISLQISEKLGERKEIWFTEAKKLLFKGEEEMIYVFFISILFYFNIHKNVVGKC